MEKRINNKARTYFQTFKEEIKNILLQTEWANENHNKVSQFLQFVYDYQPLEFDKSDFQKRKRVKNIVPFFERCCALRANKEQCTRRRKNSSKFCGTHIKGIPHGEVNQNQENKPTHQKKTVWAEDIKGIVYWIDKECNVYDSNDIIQNNINPRIIAKYVLDNGVYTIPSLFKK